MKSGRLEKGIKNVKVSLITYAVTIVLQFTNRTLFIYFLSADYLGLNGLFLNVLSFLSLADLGVSGAITYALYTPLINNDVELIKSLMKFYKKAYTIIGYIVIGLGITLMPFLSYLINDIPKDMPQLNFYFMLFVLNSGVSYFATYRRSIIISDQKQYISSITTSIKGIVQSLVQILVLIITHSYLIYLCVMVICTFSENVIISLIATKKYPYLEDKKVDPLPKGEIQKLKKNVAAMFLHKVGSIVVNSTDILVITKFVNLASTGLYSNYLLITSSLSGALSQLTNALAASVGNLVAGNDLKHDEYVFQNLLFGFFCIYVFCSCCLYGLLEPFIELWIGKKYQLGMLTVLTIVVVFYLSGARKTVIMFRDAAGLFWHDRYKPILESFVNLLLSIPLAIKFGVAGTLLGTIISTIGVSFWVEARILFKYHFKKPAYPYYLLQVKYFLITIGLILFVRYLTEFIHIQGILGFLIKAFICSLTPIVLVSTLFYKSKEFKYYSQTLKKVLFSERAE